MIIMVPCCTHPGQQYEALSQRTRVPQAAYFREAVEDLLKKYEEPKKKAGK